MARSKGRGTAAALGLFALFAGLVGGGVLYVLSQQRPSQAVDGFARAPLGCTTTLEFSEVGTFYVFEEAGVTFEPVAGGCQPVATNGAVFGVQFSGDRVPRSVVDDDSIRYDVDGFDGRSTQRVEVTEPGEYAVAVTGGDLTVVAALGRDPDEGVGDLRRSALMVALGGIVVGLGILTLAGRRSKRAAVLTTPTGPGWGPVRRSGPADWEPEPVRTDQVPVNPHLPSEPADVGPSADPLPDRIPPSAWSTPTGDAAPLPPPNPDGWPVRSNPAPGSDPILPDAPGRTSGT